MAILVTGGARSGKSRFAEKYAASLGTAGVYIATAEARDDEMRHRIDQHRIRREESGFDWRTVEAPYDLTKELVEAVVNIGPSNGGSGGIVLIDCLTIWLSNWLLRLEREPDAETVVQAKVDELAAAFVQLSAAGAAVIAVTNEVGDGVVPAYPLGRQFRDLAGWMNQRLAAVCDEVFLVTAGIPIALKQLAFQLPPAGRQQP